MALIRSRIFLSSPNSIYFPFRKLSIEFDAGGRVRVECPQCGFYRDVDKETFAGKETVIATCPKCSCRFRFSVKDGTLGPAAPAARKAAPRVASPPEEEEDIRQVAKRAYEREAGRFAPGRNDDSENADDGALASDGNVPLVALANPWAYAPGETGWISAFYRTALNVMFSARLFFRSLPLEESKRRAFQFYLIVAIAQCAIERLWSYVFYNYLSDNLMDDPQTAALLKLFEPDPNILADMLLRCAILILQLYVFSLLIYLMYRLVAPGLGNFSLIFRILAYSSAPALLCVVPAIGVLAGLFWGLGCLVVGCKSAMDLTWPKALAGLVPLLLFFAPLLSGVYGILGQ